MAFLSRYQIANLDFKSVGENVLISDKASIYNAENIEIGDDVRIDDFCILSAGEGGITIDNNVHISAHTTIIGGANVFIGEFSAISHKCTIFSKTDDYSGEYFSSAMCDPAKRNVLSYPVSIGRNVVIGANTVILPGAKVGSNVSVGALSLVNMNLPENAIYAGIPARFIKNRKPNKFL